MQEIQFRAKSPLKLLMNPKGQIWDLKSLRSTGVHIEAPPLSPEICSSLVKDLHTPKGKGKPRLLFIFIFFEFFQWARPSLNHVQVLHSLLNVSRSRKSGSLTKTLSNKRRQPRRQQQLRRCRPCHQQLNRLFQRLQFNRVPK